MLFPSYFIPTAEQQSSLCSFYVLTTLCDQNKNISIKFFIILIWVIRVKEWFKSVFYRKFLKIILATRLKGVQLAIPLVRIYYFI